MRGNLRTRRVTLAGAAAAVLLVGGLLAVITDTVTVEDNELESGPVEAPADIELAYPVDGDCLGVDVEWSRTTLEGVLSGLDLQSIVDARGTYFFDEPTYSFCLRSVAPEARDVRLGYTLVDDLEAPGGCTATEVAAGDLDCGSDPGGFTGELSDIARFRVTPTASSASTCPEFGSDGFPYDYIAAPVGAPEPTKPGTQPLLGAAVCHYEVRIGWIQLIGQTLDDVLRAETDVLTYDIVVEAEVDDP